MALNGMDADEDCRRFHYLYAVEYKNNRILRPTSMSFVIGCSKCADFVVSTTKAAKKQCEISYTDSGWILRNLSPEGTSLVGRSVVRDELVKVGPEVILKIGGIYMQCKSDIEYSQPPLQVLKIIVLIGEKFCQLACDFEKESDEESIVTESPECLEMKESSEFNKAEENKYPRDEVIESLNAENKHIMQEVKELKSALRQALTEKGEAELKAAQIKEELNISRENSAKEIIIGETIESELQCSICNELLIDATTLSCSHSFCEFCLMQWKKKNRICPLCRGVIHHECKTRAVDNLIERVIGNLPDETQSRRKELVDMRKALKRRPKTPSRGHSNKRKRTLRVGVVAAVHEVVNISPHFAIGLNETINISSDDEN